jgi:hypothetical protein
VATYAAKQVAGCAGRPAVSADVPILASKITAPGVPDWGVPRPRITKLIAQGARWCRLTVITGPAGAGKTMALALWAAAEAGTVAWVCLDEFDNRPGFFWSYVVAALRRSGVAVPETLPAAAREREADHVFLLGLAAALAAQDPPVTLVLDDLHLLADPEVLDGLDYVLRNAGSGLRLVASARMERMDPLLPLRRYRLACELAEIRASDLAFTVAEAGELLARHGRALPAGSLECLTRRSEGWAAGLRLAAISMGTHPGGEDESADCLGHLALAESLRGRLGHAAQLAAQATAALTTGEQQPPVLHSNLAALAALAWVHLEHNELPEAHRRLEQADAALGATRDKLIGAAAGLAAAYCGLTEVRAAVTAETLARARSRCPVPAWLDQRLSLAESRAYAAAGDIQAALVAAGRPGRDDSPEAAVTLARAWAAAGDAENATRALTPVLAADRGAPERVRLQAWLVDAQLGYDRGDRTRGRRSLATAPRLAEPEQYRLPFVIERGWIGPLPPADVVSTKQTAMGARCMRGLLLRELWSCNARAFST